jgi:hypothetical protein
MGILGATVAGTIRVLLATIPKTSAERKRRLQMNKFRLTIKLIAIAAFMLAFASLAQAQATRTWVSGVGDDANPCSRTAPCKTFAGAISKTADCGEIDALDPGGFGAVTITKSITLDGTGTMASILASGTTGVIINADNTKVITLRGLSINGACTGVHGINIIQAKKVNVEDCVIFRFNTGNGINADDADGVTLTVRNTVIRDNTHDAINLHSSTSQVKATLYDSSFTGNEEGIHARSGSVATARNCVFSNNTINGVFAESASAGQQAIVRVWASLITLNGSNGVQAGNGGNAGTSTVEIAQNQINNNNGNGVFITTGGSVATFTNNSIAGNGTNGCAGCVGSGPGN